MLPRRNPVNLAAGVTKFMETGNKENLIYGGKKRKKTIEETFGELEELIKKLESGESSLEESFQYYETGMKLVKFCNEKK
uniref:exodeoxyribonuclease VII small subunit n=1 Tax=Clostridium sp. NkU-1 TaxID=1095009 RepID=UPI0032613E03